jgi:hypothetical protein
VVIGSDHLAERQGEHKGLDVEPFARAGTRAWISRGKSSVTRTVPPCLFAEFERAIIRERVRAGLQRAKAQGKVLGRRRNDDPKRLASVRRLRKRGVGIGKIARTLGIGASYIQRIVAETER